MSQRDGTKTVASKQNEPLHKFLFLNLILIVNYYAEQKKKTIKSCVLYLTLCFSVPKQTWVHLAVTISKSNKTTAGYVNGVLKGSANSSFTGDWTFMANNHTVYDIGLKRDGGRAFHGHLKDLAVFSKVLSLEEINLFRKLIIKVVLSSNQAHYVVFNVCIFLEQVQFKRATNQIYFCLILNLQIYCASLYVFRYLDNFRTICLLNAYCLYMNLLAFTILIQYLLSLFVCGCQKLVSHYQQLPEDSL